MEGNKDNSGFNAVFGGGGGGTTPPTTIFEYGSFHSQITSSLPSSGYASQVPLEFIDVSLGVSSDAFGNIIFGQQGVYILECTLQFVHTSTTSADTIYAWISQNFSNLPYTSRQFRINPNINTLFMSLCYTIRVYPDTFGNLPQFQIYWTCTTTDVQLTSLTSTGSWSDIPSAIVNVFQIG